MLDEVDHIKVIVPGHGEPFGAQIIDGGNGEYVAAAGGSLPNVSPGDTVDVLYEELNEHLRQPAEILSLMSSDDGRRLIRLRTIGAPQSVESRQCYRIVPGEADLTVHVAGAAHCAITDLSTTGLSVEAPYGHEIGEILEVELQVGGRPFRGSAIVRSVRSEGTDRARYGLDCSVEGGGTELLKALQIACMSVQREHLRMKATGI